jgi:hypothetical protein
MLASRATNWNSKKQQTVTLSTTEAEYMALCQTAKEATWIANLMTELEFTTTTEPTTIYSDNQGGIALARNSIHHARTKHIDIHHHFIREMVESERIQIEFCGTNSMIVDILTKGLAKDKHERFVVDLGLSL